MRSRVRTRTHGSVGRRELPAPSDPIEAACSTEFEAASNVKYNTKNAALAAQVAGLSQHTCYLAG